MRNGFLDTKWKPWEILGLQTDRKGGWNDGFLGGFHHLVYDLMILLPLLAGVLLTGALPVEHLHHVAKWFGIGAVFVHFVMEIQQAHGMRDKQVWHYWKFWKWHIGRHQDYGVPAAGLYLLYRILL